METETNGGGNEKQCENIKENEGEDAKEKESIILRIWDKIFSWHKAVERVVFIIIFLAVMTYMIFCIYSLFAPKEYYKNFERIGTVEIRD